jgi:hypothetical protein
MSFGVVNGKYVDRFGAALALAACLMAEPGNANGADVDSSGVTVRVMHERLPTPGTGGQRITDLWAPVAGRVFNLGVRLEF